MNSSLVGRRGFTLIELLVVIAIIAILAAILFPVFMAAKASAQEASCQSNAGQIGRAMLMYLQDCDGHFPNPRRYGVTESSAFTDYAYFCCDYRGVPMLLRRYMGSGTSSVSKAFRCPADPTATGVVYSSASGNTLVSYMYRLAFAFQTMSNPTHQLRDSQCRFPSRQVLFHEGAAWHHGRHSAWQAKDNITGQPWLVAVCADGHTRLWKLPFIRTSARSNAPPDDYPYDANWFTRGPNGPVHDAWDPTRYWDDM